MSNALLRILTALVGVPLLVLLIYLGGWYFGLAVLVAALLAQYEAYRLMEEAAMEPMKAVGLVLGALVALQPLWHEAWMAVLFVTVGVFVYSPFSRAERPLHSLGSTFLGVLYPTALFSFLSLIRQLRVAGPDADAAWLLTLAVFLFVWASDTMAYYVGKSIGKRPLAPLISPKKTWEGSVGGVAGALVAAVILKLTLLAFLAWPHVLALAFIGGVVGQVGDLAESRLKRSVGVKDSGTFLPGHGGLLDRFDAVFLSAPLSYLYLYHLAVIA